MLEPHQPETGPALLALPLTVLDRYVNGAAPGGDDGVVHTFRLFGDAIQIVEPPLSSEDHVLARAETRMVLRVPDAGGRDRFLVSIQSNKDSATVFQAVLRVRKPTLGVALARSCGSPNLSPRGSVMVYDDGQQIFTNQNSPDTFANLHRDPRSEINCVDVFRRRGYRFKGKAGLLPPNDLAAFK